VRKRRIQLKSVCGKVAWRLRHWRSGPPSTPVVEFPANQHPLCNTKKTGEDRHVIQRQSTSVGADRANSAAPPKTVSIAWVCLSRLPSLARCRRVRCRQRLIRCHVQVFLMTFEDVAQQYFDPLTQVQRLMLRHRCRILCRGTYTIFPGNGDDRSDLNANASHRPLLLRRKRTATSPY
jgi:hypothetical protein